MSNDIKTPLRSRSQSFDEDVFMSNHGSSPSPNQSKHQTPIATPVMSNDSEKESKLISQKCDMNVQAPLTT